MSFQKRGILMSDGEKNEVLTQKVVKLRGERETLNETIHQLQTQLNSAERENEGSLYYTIQFQQLLFFYKLVF